ncbi:Cytosine/adenosine deaminase [Novosphingobium sp. CF614]|uniref:amidohydrolase family protein n=1 Tax=Novosphingobium sp. CF614 TaxID=1884364 RepID=UPI0008F44825|nr:amidohydrolase family protein [Novosphingobium sp. CF614]SFG00563.1 Cytosine/adenosine deaminase [Novosphingobium sp. CF614]
MTDRVLRKLRAGRVLVDAEGMVLGPTEIAIDAEGRIASLAAISEEGLTREEAGALVMPALANAHDHGRGLRTLAFGAADQSLETWLPDLRRQPRVDPWLNAAVALGRLACSGVAAVNHCHNTQDSRALLAEAEAVSRAARDVGVRVAFGWPFFDRNPLVYGDLAPLASFLPEARRPDILKAADGMRDCATNFALFERAKAFEHDHFTLQYHPVAPQWARPETLAAISRASAADGRRIHMHLLETEPQREWAWEHHPRGLVRWLDSLGLLSDRLTVAHAVWLDEEDIALLARRGVTVSVNVSSNLRLRSGVPRIAELLEAGVPVAFGLDGMALDDDEDMLRELRLAWHFGARESRPGGGPGGGPGEGLDPRAVLRGALDAGHRSILGSGAGGRIEIGAAADLLVLDFAALTADCVAPNVDVIRLLLGRAQSRHIRAVWVQGRVVASSGRCVGIDLAELEARLTREARHAYLNSPPDEAAIAEMKTGVSAYYECDCHRTG